MSGAAQFLAVALLVAVVAVAMFERGVNAATERFAQEIAAEQARRKAQQMERALCIANTTPKIPFGQTLHEADLFMERDRQIDAHLAIARIERELRSGRKD